MDHRGTNFEVVEVSPYRSRWIIYPKKSLRVGKVVRGIMAQTPREMNPVPAQFLGMNEKGNRYVISALKNKRAALAGEMNQLERQLRHRRECLQHVDACLRLLDPTLAVESIPNKRLPRHINLFRQGELSRLVSDTLREADGKPLRPLEIVAAIMRKITGVSARDFGAADGRSVKSGPHLGAAPSSWRTLERQSQAPWRV
jgi:hypothetical protein